MLVVLAVLAVLAVLVVLVMLVELVVFLVLVVVVAAAVVVVAGGLGWRRRCWCSGDECVAYIGFISMTSALGSGARHWMKLGGLCLSRLGIRKLESQLLRCD